MAALYEEKLASLVACFFVIFAFMRADRLVAIALLLQARMGS